MGTLPIANPIANPNWKTHTLYTLTLLAERSIRNATPLNAEQYGLGKPLATRPPFLNNAPKSI